MKKSLRIIIIILIILGLILLGTWMRARKQATRNGTDAPTFRAFLGLGSGKGTKPIQNTPGENTSDFTDETNPDGTPSSPNNNPVRTSIFTNGGFNPVSTTGEVAVGGGFPVQGDSGSGGVEPGGGGGGPIVIDPPALPTEPACTDADLFIEFTPDEINRLNALKTRFFAIASELHTDNDLATETSNYDLFKTKSDKITELYNYCRTSPVYTSATGSSLTVAEPYGTTVPGGNGAINYRVPTPFWHDKTKDNNAFIHQGLNWKGIFSDPDLVFPERSIEHALRLNLW